MVRSDFRRICHRVLCWSRNWSVNWCQSCFQGDAKHPFNKKLQLERSWTSQPPGQLSASQTNYLHLIRLRPKPVFVCIAIDGGGWFRNHYLGKMNPSAKFRDYNQSRRSEPSRFNPAKTDYHIAKTSKEITATASNNGVATNPCQQVQQSNLPPFYREDGNTKNTVLPWWWKRDPHNQ